VTRLESSYNAKRFTLKDLPASIPLMFESPHNKNLHAAYLFPAVARTTREAMISYQAEVMSLKEKKGLSFIAVDGSFLAADAIQLIEHEAPRGILLLFLFFIGVVLVTIRPVLRAGIILLNLIGGMILLSGILWLFEIRLNIINIVAIPIILGTGIDCFLHLSYRFKEEGELMSTLRSEAPPIFVSGLTSIIGFGGLLLTSNTGLQSVGSVAVIGLTLVILLCTFLFSRCLSLETGRDIERDPVSIPI